MPGADALAMNPPQQQDQWSPSEMDMNRIPLAFVQVASRDDITFMAPRAARGPVSLQQLMTVIQTHLQADPKNVQLGQLAEKVKTMMDGGLTKSNFASIIGMVKQTLQIMKMEQGEDDRHKSWCESEIEKNTQELKDNEEQKTSLTQEVEALENQLAQVNKEIEQLRHDLDLIREQRSDAQKTRLEEQRAYDGEMVELKQAQQALYKAIVVLQEVYGKAPALVQKEAKARAVRALAVGGVPPPPETWTEKYDGQDAGKSILQMLAEIGEDMVHQEEEAKLEEEQAKAQYEKNMADYDEDSQLKQEQLVSRSGIAAKLELNKENDESDLDQLEDTLDSLRKQQLELHTGCDFILKNHAERKRMRDAEAANMQEAIKLLEAER